MNEEVMILLCLAAGAFALILREKGFSMFGSIIISWCVFFFIGTCITMVYSL